MLTPTRLSISTFLHRHASRWYFTPVVGIIFLFIIITPLIASKHLHFPSPPPPTAAPSPAPSPSSDPSDSKFNPLIPSTPTTKPKSTPNPTPQSTPTPSPTPSPTPEPTVRINSPIHQHNYDGNSIDIDFTVHSSSQPISRVEVLLNGATKHTWDGQPSGSNYHTTINDLSPDSYELIGKAFLESGPEITSGILLFGLGGTDWDAPDPTPTPTPSTSPTPTPTP